MKHSLLKFLYEELPSNATILGKLKNHQLRTEHSVREMHRYMECLDLNDFMNLKMIHVAGTKGKGSTCHFVSQILRANQKSCGLFTSPHLIDPRERVRVNGEMIDAEVFEQLAFQIRDEITKASLPLPGFFRFTCLLAMRYFITQRVQWAIMEVGIGGRYDCTNFHNSPAATAITSLAMDHVEVLGGTRSSIAWHKAGIMKPHVPCFTPRSQHPEAMAVLEREAAKVGSPLYKVDPVEIPHLPPHQQENAALALAIANHLGFNPAYQLVIPMGRQTKISKNQQTWLLDGAHTIESIISVREWYLRERDPTLPSLLLFYCSPDRDRETLMALLLPLFDEIVSVSDLSVIPPISHPQVLVTGSFHLVGTVMSHLKQPIK